VAEGRPAVEHTQTYVSACHALGYQQPDLTAHASQVRDTYDAESGLDLKMLDDDCAALRAAVNAVEEALSAQRAQVTELNTGWRGSGADSATRFLQRHCDTATTLTARVRSAAEACAALRDNLWQSVDGKVATTISIDERRAAERSSWLAAAHAVTTGTGDRSVAEELICRHVIPYVDNDIRNDWLSAVHSTAASIATSYDTAIHALTSAPDLGFEIPGDLGPSWQPVSNEPVHPIPDFPMPGPPMPADPVPTVPAAALPPPSSPRQPPSSADDMPPDGDAPLDDLSGLSSGAGGLGGLSGMTGGIGGVISSIADGIGSLISSLTGGLGDTADDPLLDDSNDDTDDPDEAEEAGGKDDGEDAEPVEPAAPAEPEADQLGESPSAAVQAADSPAEPAAPPPVDPRPADQPPQATVTPPDGSTPCEIAEDQLPQAGQ